MCAYVLVAEDDEMQAELIRRLLVQEGHTVVVVHDGRAALDAAKSRRPDLIASLHDEAVLLQRIIDDLQDLAAVDAGTFALRPEPVAVDELVAQVVAAHKARAEAESVHLTMRAEPGLWLDADPARMRQVLGNLVSNALRHTPADGTVTLTARQDADHIVLTIEDTGTGIDPAHLPHVFDRFWRAEKSRSRHTGGSGLGLSIVRQFVEAHGGTVDVRSEPGAGAEFTIRLSHGTASI